MPSNDRIPNYSLCLHNPSEPPTSFLQTSASQSVARYTRQTGLQVVRSEGRVFSLGDPSALRIGLIDGTDLTRTPSFKTRKCCLCLWQMAACSLQVNRSLWINLITLFLVFGSEAIPEYTQYFLPLERLLLVTWGIFQMKSPRLRHCVITLPLRRHGPMHWSVVFAVNVALDRNTMTWTFSSAL